MADVLKLAAWAAAALLAGCGGGSDGGSASTTNTTTTCTLSALDGVSGVARSAALDSVVQVESMLSQGSDVSPIQARSGSAINAWSVSLGTLSQARLAEVSQSSSIGVPRRIGLARDVVLTASVDSTATVLDWQSTASGGKRAAISFSSEDAKGLRLGMLVKSLPADATLRVYAQDASTAYVVSGQAVLDAVQRNLDSGDSSDNARTYWTPLVDGQEATLEIELPAQIATSAVQIAVPRLSHLVVSPLDSSTVPARAIGSSGSCEVDVNCNSSYSSKESNAVARMVFASGGTLYQCSGTLLNDTSSDGKPYFLSANHCISTQAEATSLQTYWFYRSASCNSGTLNASYTTRINGATLLYASNTTDTSFMRLVDTPPAGAMYAGWVVDPATIGSSVAGLHFPQGDLQKISTGTVASFQLCSQTSSTSQNRTCSTSTSGSGNFLNAVFSSGVTEEGSSGSPLFQTSSGGGHYLVGQLFGGDSSCTNTAGSNIYGRFDLAYSAALSQWLGGTTSSTGSTCGS